MIFETLHTEKKTQILEYLGLLLEINKNINLTRIDSIESALLLHIEDSLHALEQVSKEKGVFIDLGSGGGFPGVPLSIASDRRCILLDGRKKKMDAVRSILKEMNLDEQIECIGLRSEEYILENQKTYNTVISRAVSALPSVLELATPLMSSNGQFIAMCGKLSNEDLEKAASLSDLLGLKLFDYKEYSLIESSKRTLIIFRRVDNPRIKLPRRTGLAQKRPLL